MMTSITSPVTGSPLRADWARQITDAVNRTTAAAQPGLLARDGAGAFGGAPLPANHRARRPAGSGGGTASKDGYTGEVRIDTVRYGRALNSSGVETGDDVKLWARRTTLTYDRGLLIAVTESGEREVFATVPHSTAEY